VEWGKRFEVELAIPLSTFTFHGHTGRTMNHWMVKQEPTAYSWEDFEKDGCTAWTGVRNFQARNNLRAMRVGDPVLYYYSVVGKEVVGIAKVARAAYPDPTAREGDWSCVDLVPEKRFQRAVPLADIKASAKLKEIALLRQSRLSVMPLTKAEYAELLRLGKG
jgi:predicted RNA-binding protein with PUA-like domain